MFVKGACSFTCSASRASCTWEGPALRFAISFRVTTRVSERPSVVQDMMTILEVVV